MSAKGLFCNGARAYNNAYNNDNNDTRFLSGFFLLKIVLFRNILEAPQAQNYKVRELSQLTWL